MDAERKRLIVEALRSGKYKQGRRCLRSTEDNYCCLGVICEISGVGSWDPTQIGGMGNSGLLKGYVYRIGAQASAGVLPDAIKQWSGIDTTRQYALISMNDEGKSFEDIAEHIEAAF